MAAIATSMTPVQAASVPYKIRIDAGDQGPIMPRLNDPGEHAGMEGVSMIRTSQRLRWAALAVTAAACWRRRMRGGTSSKDKTATAGAKPAGSPAVTKAAGTATAVGAKVDIAGVDELKDGSLDIGSDVAYAPIEFLDAKRSSRWG